jgi:poly-gamma-glutamate capsule biosynthesis protein CapA/YwtB (metallophosphatase superfamily)
MKTAAPFSVLLAVAICGLSGAGLAQEPPKQESVDPLSQIPGELLPATVRDGFEFAAVGDMIYGRPEIPKADPGFEQVVKILQDADVAFANQEGSILDLGSFKGHPQAENGGGYPLGLPAIGRDIKNMGIDIVSKANNHATDFGVEGLAESRRLLEEAGVLTAGSGRNRATARMATLLDTPGGRVAVVATASTFTPMSMAADALDELPDRPGISVLRTRKVALVTAEEMAALRTIGARLNARERSDNTEITLLGQTYRVADRAGLTYEMNDTDRYEILRAIRGAKQVSDMVVFTIHAHENAGAGDDRVPADFQQVLYHNAIDAGADIVAVHGPHLLRGIEIYKGRPIFYGLGTFTFQMSLSPNGREAFEEAGVDPRKVTYYEFSQQRGDLPRAWFDSMIAVSEFRGGQVKAVRLYPLDLSYDMPRKHRGYPQRAAPEKSRAILEQLRKDSAPYGTHIRIENGVGVIQVEPAS